MVSGMRLGCCWLRGMYSMMNAAFICFFACSQFDVNIEMLVAVKYIKQECIGRIYCELALIFDAGTQALGFEL